MKQFRLEYDQVRQTIKNDPDLSAAGKKKRLKKFESVKRNEARKMIHDLRSTAIIGALSFKAAEAAAEAERKRSLTQTDFSRLLYNAMVAKSQIDGAGIAEIKKTWETVKESGDDYLIKAWRETLPGVIRTKKYKDDTTTNAKPGLLQDIAASKTEEERQTTAGEKDALRILYEVYGDAQELGLTFGSQAHGGSDGGIKRRIMSGISLDGDQVQTDFDLKIITKPSGAIERETAEQLIERLESEYQASAEYINSKMGTSIDPDFEDLTGGVQAAEKDAED
jgi:hypothetical protein